MEALLAQWRKEVVEAETRIQETNRKYGPGRSFYSDGIADTYRKCIAELSEVIENNARKEQRVQHTSENR